MPREFRDLSPVAQRAIVDCVLGIDRTNLPESVQDEIRDWATPPHVEPNGWYAMVDPDDEDVDAELRECFWVFSPIEHFDKHGAVPDVHQKIPLPSGFNVIRESCAEFVGIGDPRDVLARHGFTINENPNWWYDRT